MYFIGIYSLFESHSNLFIREFKFKDLTTTKIMYVEFIIHNF